MELFVYSDESGVLDKKHNDFFVFGGLLFLSKEDKDNFNRKYLHAERALRSNDKYQDTPELKASAISNNDKGKLYRSTNQSLRFGVVIDERKMLDSIFEEKKSKQRFLDYAFKIGLKRFLQSLINNGTINPYEIDKINVFVDEHTTATNGKYELHEALLQEFKYGTYNENWSKKFPPIFPGLNDLDLQYCDSSKKPLVRAADIIANKIYHAALTNTTEELKVHITYLP